MESAHVPPAVSYWQANLGINFYGYLVAPKTPLYDQIDSLISTTRARAAKEHAQRAKDIADIGLPLLPALDNFTTHLLAFQSTEWPHTIIHREAPHTFYLNDITGPNLLLNIFTVFSELSDLHEGARATLHGIASQRWDIDDSARGWLADNFKYVFSYLAQLVQGNFIDRNGTALTFALNVSQLIKNPSISSLNTNLAADSPQIAGELLYALIECLGDIRWKVPANVGTYDPKETKYQQYTCFESTLYDKTDLKTYLISPGQKRFTAVNVKDQPTEEYDLAGALIAYASKTTEGAVKSCVGTLIRGVSAAGVNNEALAEVIATAASVAAKKAMEDFTSRLVTAFLETMDIQTPDKDLIIKTLRNLFLPSESVMPKLS